MNAALRKIMLTNEKRGGKPRQSRKKKGSNKKNKIQLLFPPMVALHFAQKVKKIFLLQHPSVFSLEVSQHAWLKSNGIASSDYIIKDFSVLTRLNNDSMFVLYGCLHEFALSTASSAFDAV